MQHELPHMPPDPGLAPEADLAAMALRLHRDDPDRAFGWLARDAGWPTNPVPEDVTMALEILAEAAGASARVAR